MFWHVITTGLLLVILFQRQVKLSTLRRIEAIMATDEQLLQQILNKLSIVEVQINELHAEVGQARDNNPKLADEFSGIQAVLDRISSTLSSVPPDPIPEDP